MFLPCIGIYHYIANFANTIVDDFITCTTPATDSGRLYETGRRQGIIDRMQPKICTLVFLIESDNILLAMKKRGFGKGRWNGAGGKIEPGEKVEEAMIRETQEEIGITPIEYSETGHLKFYFPDGVQDIIGTVFVCTKWDGDPVETEEMAPRWFKKTEIPYDKMWQDDIHWLPHMLAGKYVRGTFTFDANEKMLEHAVEVD